MQPGQSNQITTEGFLPGKVTPMGIQQKDMAHIMGVLTRQYSDTAMAVLREYSANARDEHILLGLDRPIEVELPNRFNSNLIIRDFGRGMSAEFVEQRYSQYGDSAKRDDPNQIGGFGIGGKAALSYTDSFTLVTVCDGMKGVFVISRDSNGAGSIKTLLVTPTDEPNGTEIKVPAKNIEDFTAKAEFLFKFWPEGSVIVNGEAPRSHTGIPVGEGLWYSREAQQSYLVAGGVPYRVANPWEYMPKIGNRFNNKFHFIAEVGIEDIEITPSREDLEYTEKTIAVLKDVGNRFTDQFIAMAKKEISDQPTAPEAYDKWTWWKVQVPADFFSNMKYKGMTLSENVDVSGILWKRHSYRYQSNGTSVATMTVETLRNTLVVTGQDNISSYSKSRIRLWSEAKRVSNNAVLFAKTVPTCPWIEVKSATWDEILTVKPQTTARSKAGMVEIFTDRGLTEDIDINDLKDWDSRLVLITPKRARQIDKMARVQECLTNFGQDVTLVKLPENRWNKFRRDIAMAEDFDTYISDLLKLEIASISQTTWDVRSLNSSSRYLLRRVPREDVNDPDLKKLIDLIDSSKTGSDESKVNKIQILAGETDKWADFSSKTGNDWFVTTYPLVASMYYDSVKIDELVIYLNASYEARKDS